nr:MAG TPA: hypothetical protein [Caudoviricetes sp.]
MNDEHVQLSTRKSLPYKSVGILVTLYNKKKVHCYVSGTTCYKISDTNQKPVAWSNQSALYESESVLKNENRCYEMDGAGYSNNPKWDC